MRKTNKNIKATSLDDAIELTKEFAKANKRRPSKVMCELMGVDYKTYMRWLIDGTMPLNRVIQLESLAGCQFISDYLSTFHGAKVVVEIPRGAKGKIADLAELQSKLADVMSILSKFYQDKVGADETVSAINDSLSGLAFQRENVKNYISPELVFGDDDE